jgi:hypothetical protein
MKYYERRSRCVYGFLQWGMMSPLLPGEKFAFAPNGCGRTARAGSATDTKVGRTKRHDALTREQKVRAFPAECFIRGD